MNKVEPTFAPVEIPDDSSAKHIEPLDQLVSGPRLLEILWDAASRPSYRWLKYKTASRTIPSVKSGGRTWFVPREVREALARPAFRRGRPSGSWSKGA